MVTTIPFQLCQEGKETSFANHFGSEPFIARLLQKKQSCNNAKGICDGFCRAPILTNLLIYLHAGLARLGISHRNRQNCSRAGFYLPPAKTGRCIQLRLERERARHVCSTPLVRNYLLILGGFPSPLAPICCVFKKKKRLKELAPRNNDSFSSISFGISE